MSENAMNEPAKTEHAYDGIEEFDNPLPGWWKWLFIISIVYCPFYWVYYHGNAQGRTMHDHYDSALAESTRLQFAEMGELAQDRETLLRCLSKDNLLKVGQIVFKTNCISCHGRNGEGKVGVNLTDNVYKNVSQIEDIARVIAKGAGGNAMPAWSNRLHPNEVVLVSAYVASLRNTNAPGGRPPEGREIAPWPEWQSEPESEPEADPKPSE